jgi:hypothetical protein
VAIELFDRPQGFTAREKAIVADSTEFSSDLLQQVLAQKQIERLLADALTTALAVSDQLTNPGMAISSDELPSAVLDQFKLNLQQATNPVMDSESTLELAHAIRELATKHGPGAVRRSLAIIREAQAMLDEATGQ